MKKIIALCFCFLTLSLWAQFSDCNTALSVCNDFYQENNSPAGTGNLFETVPGSCNGSEFNSAWYVFTVQENGSLNFILQPNNNNDDYDWSLFNITDNGCGGISSGASPEVSCNSWGSFGTVQGPTGISSANGGSGSSNGPGDLNGPPFNSDLNVQAGQVFALVIMNFSATLSGYSLDFGASTASIFDDVPPSITAVVPDCGQTEVVFTLSENVLSDNLVPSNLTFTNNGNTIPVDQVNFTPGDYVHTFSVSTANFDQLLGPITLTFNNPPTDLCGNPLPIEYSFELDGPFAWDYTVNPSCAGENGSIEVSASGVDGDCFNMVMNNVSQTGNGCDTFTADGLNSGTYTVNLTSIQTGCVTTISIQVEDLDVSVDAGEDVILCDLQTSLAASFVGETFEWITTTGVTFGNSSDPTSNVSAPTAGLITLTAQAGIDDCFVTDFVNVTFNFPPDLNFTTTEESCFGNCDGSVTFVNPLGNNMSIQLNGQTQSGSEVTFDQLCQTSYPAVVSFSAQCIANYDIVIPGYPEVVALFSASPSETSINNLNITVTSFSQNADTILWEILGQPELTSDQEVYEFTLPAVVANYPVQLTVTGPNGCTDQEVSYIIVRDEFQVYLPNSFTPNDDGINDFFVPKFSYAPKVYELLVFNHWGETVFQSNDPNEVWLGEKLGGSHYGEPGVYLWRLKVRGLEIETEEYQGHVTLIR